MPMRNRNILVLATLLLCGQMSLVGCSDSNAKAASTDVMPSQAVAVGIETVQPRPMRDALTLVGNTEAMNDVSVSAELAGQVEWIGPAEGERVKAGQPVVKVDHAQRLAALGRAEAACALASERAQRRLELFRADVISKEELDQAATEQTLAQQDLSEARTASEKGVIKAPIAGVVNVLHVDPGEYVGEGDPVLEIVSVDRIKVVVRMPEMDVRFIAKGQPVAVGVDAYPGERWQGVVDYVSYKADQDTKTFAVRVVVDNPDTRIRPGMIARAEFKRRIIPDAVTVPLFALRDEGGERILFVEEEGKAHARTVTLGVVEGDRVQVLSGLCAGERAIVSGWNLVEEGMAVTVQ
jgi:membrane fusion protein (multidrug efflux system)